MKNSKGKTDTVNSIDDQAQDREEWKIWCKEPVNLKRTKKKIRNIMILSFINTCNRNEK